MKSQTDQNTSEERERKTNSNTILQKGKDNYFLSH